ncbi:MAG TPA: hypothetical protein VH724_13475, partial [Candidatus Angelobacter sp.]|nr:hypothetical protein [Candidatus Angelobacter sp.]
RIFALMTLATSMSCFAATEDSKHDAVANTSSTEQQAGCADARHAKKQKQDKKTQDADQNEKEFEKVLMAIYG